MQVADSAWLGGLPWPGPDCGYRPLPRLGVAEDSLAGPERAVLGELAKLGVTEQLLQADLRTGVRWGTVKH